MNAIAPGKFGGVQDAFTIEHDKEFASDIKDFRFKMEYGQRENWLQFSERQALAETQF